MQPRPVNKLGYCERMSTGIVEMASTQGMMPRASIVLRRSSGIRRFSATDISVERHFDRHISLTSNLQHNFHAELVTLLRQASVLVLLYGVSCLNLFLGITVTLASISNLNLISCLPSTVMTAYQATEFLTNSSTSRKTFEVYHVMSLTELKCEGLPADYMHMF